MNTLISSIMDANIASMVGDNKVNTLLKFISDSKRYVIITNHNGKPVGIISQTDIVKYFMDMLDAKLNKKEWDRELEKQIKNVFVFKSLITITKDKELSDVLDVFEKNEFHALPVIDAKGMAVGIITFDSMLKKMNMSSDISSSPNSGFDFNNHRVSSEWMSNIHF